MCCRLYIPTVLVVGLHGWLLSPLLIVVCDMFVYSEFLIHPMVLFVSSDRLRRDIWLNLLSNYQVSRRNNFPIKISDSQMCRL